MSSAKAPHILRLTRTDTAASEHLLLHISQSGSNLDLKLVATDHQHLYHATLKDSQSKSLQSPNFSGDLAEWKDILRYALLHHRPDDESSTGHVPESLQGLETVAAISGETLTVTFRKNISGITQRLGSLKLILDDEREEVSPFDWVDSAALESQDLRKELEALRAATGGREAEVAGLKAQLEDLTRAKKEFETELVGKFAKILNAKKLKIRDLQRLSSGQSADGQMASSNRSVGKAKESRGGKRKAQEGIEQANEEEEDENDGEDGRQEETPPRSGAETDEEEEGIPPSHPTNSKSHDQNDKMDVDEPPPRRQLPFSRKSASVQPPATSNSGKITPANNDDDDETDDEL